MASNGATDWRKLREFAAVDLTQSYVLSCELQSETLLIDVDLLLLPEHPIYEKPRPAQKVCIRPAVIEFPYCETISGDHIDAGSSASDAARMIRPGAITGFRRLGDGRYELQGAFGAILIDAERPILRLKGP